MNKIYAVMAVDDGGDTWLDSAFKSKERAERRASRYNTDEENIDMGYQFYVRGVHYYEDD